MAKTAVHDPERLAALRRLTILDTASGTSGMTAAINGVLNLSVLDGWWAEGYSPEVGWVIDGVSDEADASSSTACSRSRSCRSGRMTASAGSR